MTRRDEKPGAIKRRQFLQAATAASLGAAAIGCTRGSTDDEKQVAHPTPNPRAFPAIKRTVPPASKGAFVTFEGLCAIVLPQQSGDPVRVGLMAGHDHIGTMVLSRDAVSGQDSWRPVASDDLYYYFPLAGLQVAIKSSAASPIQINRTKLPDACSALNQWDNLRWALDVREELGANNPLKKNWWTDANLVDAAFTLDVGWIEGGFDGHENNWGPDLIKWVLPNRTERILKQVVRYRLDAQNITLEASRPGQTPMSLTLDNNALAYVFIKHFPLGHTRDRLPQGTYLKEVEAYYSLLDGFSTSSPRPVPQAADYGHDCIKPSTPDCTCCPPAVYA
jgi:hypothetical protein